MPAGGGYVAQSNGANGDPSDAHLYEWNVSKWPMRATAEVRWFSAAYLVPHFAGGWNEELCLPACDRQAVQYTLLHVVDTVWFSSSLRLGNPFQLFCWQ